MKKFLAAAFHISLFQLLLVLGMTGLKYWLGTAGLDGSVQLTLVFIAIGAFLVLLTGSGLSGHLQNQGYTVESWVAARPESGIRVRVARFIQWAQAFSIAIGYVVFLYFITPTSISLFIACFAGFVIGNITRFLNRKSKTLSESTS